MASSCKTKIKFVSSQIRMNHLYHADINLRHTVQSDNQFNFLLSLQCIIQSSENGISTVI